MSVRQKLFQSLSNLAVIVLAAFLAMLPLVASSADGVTDAGSASAAMQQWEVILGFLQPLAIALIVQATWPSPAKAIVSFACAVLTTTVGMYLQGDFSGVTDWATSVLTVFAVSITAYYGIWKPAGVAPAIEAKTSKGAS